MGLRSVSRLIRTESDWRLVNRLTRPMLSVKTPNAPLFHVTTSKVEKRRGLVEILLLFLHSDRRVFFIFILALRKRVTRHVLSPYLVFYCFISRAGGGGW